jgi:large subunit ribosomal protein L17
MRHQVKGRKLGRTTPHRKATLKALSVALIDNKRIQTTLPKAKELRSYLEPIITKAKNDTTHNRRQAFAALQDKYAVTELFENIAPAVGDRPGGYTRVLKIGKRQGDAADMAVMELVDFNDEKPEKRESKKKRTRRAGKSIKTEDDAPVVTEAQKDEPDEKSKSIEAEKPKVEEAMAEEVLADAATENTVEEKQEEKEVKSATAETESTPVDTTDEKEAKKDASESEEKKSDK